MFEVGAVKAVLRAMCGVATALAIVTIAGCGGDGGETAGKDAAGGGGEIKIGIPTSLSGDFAVYGAQHKDATELAVAEINAAGGVLGRKLRPVYADDRSQPGPATEQVRSLLRREHVDALIGVISSAVRDAIIPTVARSKTVFLYPTTYEGGVARKFEGKGARYVFTTGPVSEQYIKPFVPHLVAEHGKRFYFLGADFIYGTESVKNAKKYLAEAGGEDVGTDFIPFGTSDFGTVLNKIEKAKPDVVFAVVSGPDLVFLLKQFRELGLAKKGIHFATTELDESYLGDLEANVVDGVSTSLPWYVSLENPENAKFLEAWFAAYGEDNVPGGAAVSQYYTVKLYAEAVKKAGSTDTDKVIAALEGLSIPTPQGPVTIRKEDHQALMGDLIANVQPSDSGPRYDWIKITDELPEIVPAVQGDATR
jgi:urea transport system substrate-binding protein